MCTRIRRDGALAPAATTASKSVRSAVAHWNLLLGWGREKALAAVALALAPGEAARQGMGRRSRVRTAAVASSVRGDAPGPHVLALKHLLVGHGQSGDGEAGPCDPCREAALRP